MIKIGSFQQLVSEFADKNSLKKYEVDIILWGSENPMFTQYAVMMHVPASKPTMIDAMRRLVAGGWVKIARDRKPGISRQHVITGKSRSLVTEFNLRLGNI